MSTTNAPFGLRPVRHLNGKFVPPPRAIPGGILSGYTTSIYFQGPVLLNSSGQLNVATTTNDFYGVFAGCQYVSATTGLLTPSMFWPASATYVAGTMVAYVWDDPSIIYEIQADGSIASTAVGDQADFTSGAIASGSTVTGLSSTTISSSLETAGQQGQLSIRGFGTETTNAAGDAYTIVEVQIAQSQFVANKVGF